MPWQCERERNEGEKEKEKEKELEGLTSVWAAAAAVSTDGFLEITADVA
jgi:hypothetical protein